MEVDPAHVALAFTVAFFGSALSGIANLLISTRRDLTRRNVAAHLLYYGMFGVGIAAFNRRDGFSWSGIMLSLIAGIVVGLTGISVLDAISLLKERIGINLGKGQEPKDDDN